MQHVRVPGMLHGRVVRPRGQGGYGDGARVLSLDADSIRDIPGARVVRRRDFVGVVASEEWNAVRAAHQLRVTWDQPESLPATPAALFERMRAAKTIDSAVVDRGGVDAAFAAARYVGSHRFHSPYQIPAGFGPNCGIADANADSPGARRSTHRPYSAG